MVFIEDGIQTIDKYSYCSYKVNLSFTRNSCIKISIIHFESKGLLYSEIWVLNWLLKLFTKQKLIVFVNNNLYLIFNYDFCS